MDREKLLDCLERMGISGQIASFLKAVYMDVSGDVKVGKVCGKPFRMACSLQQGCILSPLLFSLYINSLDLKLKEAEVGVTCRKQLISVLLYADDAVILAEDEKFMRCGLTRF